MVVAASARIGTMLASSISARTADNNRFLIWYRSFGFITIYWDYSKNMPRFQQEISQLFHFYVTQRIFWKDFGDLPPPNDGIAQNPLQKGGGYAMMSDMEVVFWNRKRH
jgi:hypothetical protein